MNESPLVSVIVTTYNREELLLKTIKSIQKQTFRNFELIVVDNYSDYPFLENINSLSDDRIRAFQNLNDGVIAINRNFGLNKARGKFVAFCDDDDYWEADKLEKQINAVEKSEKDKVIVYTDARCFDENHDYIQQNKQITGLKNLVSEANIFFSSILVTFPQAIRFAEGKEYFAIEDYKFSLDLHYHGYTFIHVPSPLINYRLHISAASQGNSVVSNFRRIFILTYLLLKYENKKENLALFGKHIFILSAKIMAKLILRKD